MGKRIYQRPEKGQRIHCLTATGNLTHDKYGRTTAECVCDCGKSVNVLPHDFVQGFRKSCGCIGKVARSNGRKIAITRKYVGQKYNMLTVTGRSNVWKGGKQYYDCKCDCGEVVACHIYDLTKNKKHNCGCRKGMRLPDGQAGFNRLYKSYQKNALSENRKSRAPNDLEFDLTPAEFKILTQSDCYYCGNSPSYKSKGYGKQRGTHSTYLYNGIDRVDNNKGYITTNCVSCCGICNVAKGKLLQSEFLAHMRRIAIKHPS